MRRGRPKRRRPPSMVADRSLAMTRLRKLISDLQDIRTAVNAAREYNVLASLPPDAVQRRDPLKAFLPN